MERAVDTNNTYIHDDDDYSEQETYENHICNPMRLILNSGDDELISELHRALLKAIVHNIDLDKLEREGQVQKSLDQLKLELEKAKIETERVKIETERCRIDFLERLLKVRKDQLELYDRTCHTDDLNIVNWARKHVLGIAVDANDIKDDDDDDDDIDFGSIRS